ncbi:MAG: class I SAM-dependent methyltransferase [Thermoplasmata archaeon]
MRRCPLAPEDRWCRPRALDNSARRWLMPVRRDLDPLALAPGLSVADLGTGVGYYLTEIGRRVGPSGRVVAVDPDAANLEIARGRRSDAPSQFLLRSAASVPSIPTGSVDRVLLSLVLCCLVDKEGALDEAWRILKPGGLVLASYPRGGDLRRRWRSLAVTSRRWSSLLGRHPWIEHPIRRGLLLNRHLLERAVEAGPASPEGPAPVGSPREASADLGRTVRSRRRVDLGPGAP